MKKLLLITILLSGCSTMRTMDSESCVYLASPENVYENYLVFNKRSDVDLGFTLPVDVPVDVKIKTLIDKQFKALQQLANQNNIAVATAFKTIGMVASLNPCDKETIAEAFKTMQMAIKTMGRVKLHE